MPSLPPDVVCGPGVSDAFLYVVKGAHLCLCCSGQGLLLVPQVSQCVSCDSCLAGSDDAEHEGKPSGLGPQQRRECVRLSLIAPPLLFLVVTQQNCTQERPEVSKKGRSKGSFPAGWLFLLKAASQ